MTDYLKVTGRKGFITYKFADKYLYSNYDPYQEAALFIEKSERKSGKFALTFCGADFVNAALLKKGYQTILSFEPIIFDDASDSSKILRCRSLNELEARILQNNIDPVQIELFIWLPFIETNAPIFLQYLKQIKNLLNKITLSNKTEKHFGFVETRNFLRNIYANNKFNILCKSAKKTNPALIIASGYSLIDNIDFIKSAMKKAYLCALPSALPFLEASGITPDLAIVTDPGYPSYYHMAKFKKNILAIAPLSIQPTIVSLNNYKFIFFNYQNFPDKFIFDDANSVSSPPEGSVIFNLLNILPQLGFDTSIIVGLDFSYYKNRSHINEGYFEKEYYSQADYFKSIDFHLKRISAQKDKFYYSVGDKSFYADISLKIYYEHFIDREYDLEILTSNKCYNPLSDKIKKVGAEYFDLFENKSDLRDLLEIKQKTIDQELIIKLNSILYNDKNMLKDYLYYSDDSDMHKIFLKKIKSASIDFSK
ncbi:MAG TPA: DUF115 domain-containing protein [Spirochaetota bacterium]|jgi:hypothetical protein|nr:MAG: hypothetical protein BWX91_01472 [Spirochaetes bacterium ADurb.Bin133]HNZ26567.1 DUF115 domain-containing protein [Spirochaetota bacterium]HPY87043.1 DUF115 domain-containing protein [Spirochaetota bacterium]HQB60120.1 DUF115 domain-containing protein [Spirochaetota bacterium]